MKAKSLAIPYAISEGLVIGCLCGLLEVALPNMGLKIASIALLATLSIFLAAIFLYTKKVIKVGNRFSWFFNYSWSWSYYFYFRTFSTFFDYVFC